MKHLNSHLCLALSIIGSVNSLEAFSSWGNKLEKMFNSHMGKDRQPGANKDTIEPRHENIGPRSHAASNAHGYTMTETQARNYIDQCIAAIDFSLRPTIQDEELKSLSRCIKDSVERGANTVLNAAQIPISLPLLENAIIKKKLINTLTAASYLTLSKQALTTH